MEYRILVVCQRFWPENRKLADICEGFMERGMKVDVLCGQPSFPTGEQSARRDGYEIYKGIRIFRVFETDPENRGSLGIFANYVSFRLSSVAGIKELQKIRYDRIFIYQVSPVTMCAAGLKLGAEKQIPVVLFAAELWPHTAIDELDVRNGLFRLFLEKAAAHYYLQADKIIVNSLNTKTYFEQTLHIAPEKIAYIPQAAEKIYENPVRDHDLLERFAGSFKIVYTGQVSRKQRFETLVEAAKLVRKKGIKNIRFLIAGKGPGLDRLKEEVEQAGLSDWFVFEEQLKICDIPRYLDLADVLFDAGRQNDAVDFYVPDKLPSYMAAGKPLLLCLGGDAKNIVKEAECGFVCEPDDADSLYQNILKLYKMTWNERRVLGVNARQYQREHFNRDRNIVRLMEEIHETGLAGASLETDRQDDLLKASRPAGEDWIDADFQDNDKS